MRIMNVDNDYRDASPVLTIETFQFQVTSATFCTTTSNKICGVDAFVDLMGNVDVRCCLFFVVDVMVTLGTTKKH